MIIIYMKLSRRDVNILKNYKYEIKGLDCASCAMKIEESLKKQKDLSNVSVNFSTSKLFFKSTRNLSFTEIQKLVQSVEPEVTLLSKKKEASKNLSKKKHMIIFSLGICLFFISSCFKNSFYLKNILMILSYILLLSRTSFHALKLLIKNHTINENFLITVSCIGAYLVGESLEGAMVIILYEIGKILEEKAIHNTRKSISDLMDMKVEYTSLEDGTIVSSEEVKVGDNIIVKPGEKVPLDGIVIEGTSHLNTSSLTGESHLTLVSVTDEILSGSINEESLLKIKVTKNYENSTVSQILELLENATDKKAKTETFVNKVSKVYTPIVLILSFLLAAFLPIFTNLSYSESIYRGLIFLIISCPCAIAISVPLSYFSGIGRASKDGILIKGSDYLDALKDIKQIVFDKTGTLTTGQFDVTKITVLEKSYQEEDILYYASLGENYSNHPLAKAIVKYYKKKLDTSSVEKFQEISGQGLVYEFKNKKIKVGSASFCGYQEKLEESHIFVSIDNQVIGFITLNDVLKKETKEALSKLKQRNIEVKMFTGDTKKTALQIGRKLGINEVKFELLPNQKYQELEKIKESLSKEEKVAFVGDGINDSPVLALADVGISMGSLGASAAIEASDVVITTDNLLKIDRAIEISNFTNKIIKQNLSFALMTKIVIMILSTVGLTGMWQAIFADVGVTLITILNTIRILKHK